MLSYADSYDIPRQPPRNHGVEIRAFLYIYTYMYLYIYIYTHVHMCVDVCLCFIWLCAEMLHVCIGRFARLILATPHMMAAYIYIGLYIYICIYKKD